jgi:hypothetical protein
VDRSFDVQVDGNLIHAQRLTGKPVADNYLMAAKLLGVEPSRDCYRGRLLGVEAGLPGSLA